MEKKLSRATEFKFFVKMVSLLGLSVIPVEPPRVAKDMEWEKEETDEAYEREEEVVGGKEEMDEEWGNEQEDEEEEEEEEEEQEEEQEEAKEEEDLQVWEDSITHLKAGCKELSQIGEGIKSSDNSSSSISSHLSATHECLMVVLQENVYQVRQPCCYEWSPLLCTSNCLLDG